MVDAGFQNPPIAISCRFESDHRYQFYENSIRFVSADLKAVERLIAPRGRNCAYVCNSGFMVRQENSIKAGEGIRFGVIVSGEETYCRYVSS